MLLTITGLNSLKDLRELKKLLEFHMIGGNFNQEAKTPEDFETSLGDPCFYGLAIDVKNPKTGVMPVELDTKSSCTLVLKMNRDSDKYLGHLFRN